MQRAVVDDDKTRDRSWLCLLRTREITQPHRGLLRLFEAPGARGGRKRVKRVVEGGGGMFTEQLKATETS